MITVHCTKKLLDRIGSPVQSPVPPTGSLGNWYATALFWKPQVTLFVDERTLLPVLVPLAPTKTLLERFPAALAETLAVHHAPPPFIEAEMRACFDVVVAKTANRSLIGMLNEFRFMADAYRRDAGLDLMSIGIRLAEMPCGPLKGESPDHALRRLLESVSL